MSIHRSTCGIPCPVCPPVMRRACGIYADLEHSVHRCTLKLDRCHRWQIEPTEPRTLDSNTERR